VRISAESDSYIILHSFNKTNGIFTSDIYRLEYAAEILFFTAGTFLVIIANFVPNYARSCASVLISAKTGLKSLGVRERANVFAQPRW
jgi:hypothetical protein